MHTCTNSVHVPGISIIGPKSDSIIGLLVCGYVLIGACNSSCDWQAWSSWNGKHHVSASSPATDEVKCGMWNAAAAVELWSVFNAVLMVLLRGTEAYTTRAPLSDEGDDTDIMFYTPIMFRLCQRRRSILDRRLTLMFSCANIAPVSAINSLKCSSVRQLTFKIVQFHPGLT